MKREKLVEYFEEVETTQEYDGYFCSIAEAVSIVILGSICGLQNISKIHQWAESEKVSEFLKEEWLFGKEKWEGLHCIGAIKTELEERGKN